jgi:nitric oxide reductase activation protein
VLRYPEFDRLIGRLRHGWCSVSQQAASDHQSGDRQIDSPAAAQALTIDLIRILRQSRAHQSKATRIAHEGDAFDLDAVVRSRVARRLRRASDAPVFRRTVAQPREGHLMVIIDQSASSSAAWAGSTTSLLQAACAITASLAQALQTCGVQVAIAGFSSNGRHAVALRGVKAFDEPLDDRVVARLAGLRSQHSTRLGTAIRHATRAVVDARGRGSRQVMIVSDGLPWDVDVHDPHYLESDAHDAVLRARRQGVVVSCLVLDPAGAASARKVFGARRMGVLQTLADVPEQVRRLGL